jgi:hypothetical protein
MSSGYLREGANANRRTVTVAYEITQPCVLIAQVIAAAQALWPRKTAAELALRSGASVRTCERWIGERCGLSAEALAELLRSEDGLKFLEAVMGDARPKWWRMFRRQIERGQIRRDLDHLRKRQDALDSED